LLSGIVVAVGTARESGTGDHVRPVGLLPVLNGQAGLYLLAGLLAFALLARRAGGRPGPPSPEPAAAAVPGALRATEPARQTA